MKRLLLAILLSPSLAYAQQYEINPYAGALNTGTPTALNLGDDDSRLRQLGFTFDYFGQSYDNVWVTSNGFVSFSTSNPLCCEGAPIASQGTPRYTIFGLWTDLVSGGNPFVQTTTVNGLSTFTAGWYNTMEYATNRSQSFEISLNSDNSFSILYGNITNMQHHQVLAGYTGGAGEQYQIYYGQNSGHLSGTGYRFSIPEEETVPIFDPIFDIVDIGLDFLDVGPGAGPGGGGFQDTNTDPIIETFTEFDYSQPFNEEFRQEPFERVFEDNFETAFEEHFEEFHGREEPFEEAFEESFEASQEISEALEEAREIAEERAEEREEELAEEREEEAAEEIAEAVEESNEEDRLSPEELAALEAKSDQEENLNELEDKLASDEAAASEERSEKLEEELAVTDATQEEQLQQEQGQSKIESQAGLAATTRSTQAEGTGLRGDQSQLRVESALAAAGQSSLQALASASGTQSVAMSQQEQMQAMIGTTESAFFGAAADSLTGMGGLSAFGGTGSLNEGTQLSQSALGDSAGGNISLLTQSDLLLGRMDPPAEKPAREPVESDISGDESATIEAMATVPGFSQYTVASPQVQPNFYTSSSPYGRALRDNNLRMYQMSNDAVWEKLRGDQYGR